MYFTIYPIHYISLWIVSQAWFISSNGFYALVSKACITVKRKFLHLSFSPPPYSFKTWRFTCPQLSRVANKFLIWPEVKSRPECLPYLICRPSPTHSSSHQTEAKGKAHRCRHSHLFGEHSNLGLGAWDWDSLNVISPVQTTAVHSQ